jgi:uncharacterized protein YdbL (DUF1318 family)
MNRAIRITKKSLTTVAILTLGACVTVNVNFPEGAVQKAADDYVHELYKAKEKGSGGTTPGATKKSSLLDIILPSAMAQEGSLIPRDHPEVKPIFERQVGRLGKIDDFKKKGFVGEGKDGQLVLRSVPDLMKSKVQDEVEKENKDRSQLLKVLTKINSLGDESLSVFQNKLKDAYRTPSPSGTWVEGSDGSWSRK